MLQNQFKGIYFYLNNQKETHKTHTNDTFSDLISDLIRALESRNAKRTIQWHSGSQ